MKMILYPVLVMVLITFVVWLKLVRDRVGEYMSKRIHPQSAPTSVHIAKTLENIQSSDNFKNLFELPVLFYVLCICMYITQTQVTWLVWGAWGYVLLRAVHSYIHCTYNKVMHRFRVYVASSVWLLALWISFALQLL